MKKQWVLSYICVLLLIIIETQNARACENGNYLEAFLFDGQIMESKRFPDCRVTNLRQVSEVRVTSCINHLADGTFSNLPDLITLSVVELCLKTLSPGFFTRTPNLERVLLKSNHIAAIKGGTFRYANINYLDLSYNRISTIGDYAFGNMNNVALLDLEHNRLNEIRGAWFAGSEINELNLANNKITKIHKNTFEEIRSLTKLNLQYNNIHTIEDFESNDLRGLLLAGNWLTDVDFLKKLQLTYLDVSFNKISFIDIQNVFSIRGIIIHPNPWQCACLRKFWKESARYELTFRDSPELLKAWDPTFPICIVPDEQGYVCTFKKDKQFSLVQENYFQIIHYDEICKYS